MFWIGYLIGCLLIGAICYAIMQNKGYEQPTGWFFAGFFLGLLGLILVLVQPKQEQKPIKPTASSLAQESAMRAGAVRCKSCGHLNSSSAKRCEKCGTSLLSFGNSGREDNWKCSCGALNYSYETSCHRCGKSKSDCKPIKRRPVSKPAVSQTPTAAPAQKSITDQLEELKKLQEQGLISEADFEAKKKQILGI